MTLRVGANMSIFDGPGDTPTQIKAYWAPDHRLVSVTLDGSSVHIMFNARAFIRFRDALAQVQIPDEINGEST